MAVSPTMMIVSFPVLCALLLLYVHCVVELSYRTLLKHGVSYRPIQTSIADWRLIARFWLEMLYLKFAARGKRMPEEMEAPIDHGPEEAAFASKGPRLEESRNR